MANFVQTYKKQKCGAHYIFNTNIQIKNKKINIINKSNTKGKFKTWLQNESVNQSHFNIKKESKHNEENENNKNKSDLEFEKSKTEEKITPKIPKKVIKQKKERKTGFEKGIKLDHNRF